MGTGGSSGQSGQSGMDSGSQAQSGQQGQTPRERAGMSDISMLRLETAQRIVKCADQDNITLQKAIDVASSQAKGAKVVGVFLVLPQHANLGRRSRTAAVHLGPAGERVCQGLCRGRQPVKVMTIDVKNNKVLSTETRSTFVSPWEGRRPVRHGRHERAADQQQEPRQLERPTGWASSSRPVRAAAVALARWAASRQVARTRDGQSCRCPRSDG